MILVPTTLTDPTTSQTKGGQMTRCVLCGKEYASGPRLDHLKKVHGIDRKEYNRKVAMLTQAAWEFYWSHPKLRRQFPSPTAVVPRKGQKLTFRQWTKLSKVVDKHPELAE